MDPSKKPGKAQSGRLPKPQPAAPSRRAPAVRRPPAPADPAAEADEALDGEAAVGVASPSGSSSSDRAKPPQSPNVGEDESGESGGEAAPAPAPRAPRARQEKRGNTGSFKAVKGPGPARGPSAASRRAKAVDDDGEGGPKDFKHGVSLAVKIAVFSALLVAISMAGLGMKLKTVAVDEIEKQIDEKGVSVANQYASFIDPVCFTTGGEEGGPRDQAVVKWEKKLKAFIEKSDAIVNVMYTSDERGEKLVTTDDARTAQLSAIPIVSGGDQFSVAPRDKKGDVDIFQGDYTGERFKGPVRKYVQKVTVTYEPPKDDPNNPPPAPGRGHLAGGPQPLVALPAAYVHLFVKADEIDRVRDSTMHQLMVATLAGIGIAVLLSIAVAAYLASPLRALVEDIRVVANGKLDHKTVARSSDEIGLVAAQFNEMTRSLRAAQKLEQERQAIEHELTIATEIQTKLLPERIPQIPGFDLFSFYLSAKEVGGDYYDFLVIDPTHLGIIVADVSGKGIPGAMVMTMVRSLLRLASHRETSPAETLKKVNRILAKDIRRGMFVTAIYAVLDVQRKWLTVASAGHNPMVLYEAKTGKSRPVNPSGIALGFDKGRTFDENIREENIELKPGDRCVFYTDGVVEAMSDKQEEFGMERFQELVNGTASRSSKDFTNAVVEELEAHRGRGEQSDDITITTLKVD
jgi:serine phosphatase RsbU (regulator of sigma subunit)